MNLKLLVNNKDVWDSFNDELDRRINYIHTQMEQTQREEDFFRLQGQARALRGLKNLRDEVNGPQSDQA
jgi:hypothetical protein